MSRGTKSVTDRKPRSGSEDSYGPMANRGSDFLSKVNESTLYE